jgi:septum formation protein
MKLILASNSWIRKLLFDKIGIQYTCDPPEIDEDELKNTISDPQKLVVKLAELKAQTTATKYKGQDFLIIGSDSVNLRNDIAHGKPKTKEEAFHMIKAASEGHDKQVTGYCVINTKTGQQWTGFAELNFKFLPMSDASIKNYLADPTNKALLCSGGFEIDHPFFLRHCAHIEGSYGGYHALPLEKIIPILQENGFDI